MAASALHRVRRLRWQARAPGTADAFALRTLLRDRGEAVQAAIEQACAAALRQAGDRDTVWHVPRLVLRIQAADVAGLDAALPGRVAMALRDALSDAGIGALGSVAEPGRHTAALAQSEAAVGKPDIDEETAAGPPQRAQGRSLAAHDQAGLRHYLHTGTLDWALAGQADDAVLSALQQAALRVVQAVLAGTLALEALLPQPAGNIDARVGALQRWLQLLPPAWRLQWLAASPAPSGLKPALQKAWQQGLRDATAQESLPWMALWLAWGALPRPTGGSTRAEDLPEAPALRAWIAAQAAATPMAMPAKAPWLRSLGKALGQPQTPAQAQAVEPLPGASPIKPAPAETETVNPALLVPLAGLVLLHPYLPRFLAGCGVLDTTGRAIPTAQWPRACALLLALACGDVEGLEHQLPLVKLLLGLPPEGPLSTVLPRLSSADLDEVAALLAAVRQHWAALRGTGTDGLRLSFLQRRGLLRRTDGAWQLHVQAEPFDVLLDLLPWGISLVKLPWMPQPLMVAWP